ncbi:MAG: DUF58 domain-containing protein [Acidimicrobiales bacterium]
MLTRQGGLVAAASIALVVAGRLFGIFELFLVGAGGVALVIGAAVVVGLTRVRLDITRELRPARLHAGTPSTVELRASNRGSRRAPPLQLRDAVGAGGQVASVVLAPLAPGQTIAAAYALPSERRGVVAVGPLEVRVCDPFGLAASSTAGAPPTELTVWPSVERLSVLPSGSDDDADVIPDHPEALSTSGDEFYALRAYTEGDDLRRVHWRASAKRDDLVVRQDERPSQRRITIVLDARAGAYRGEAFERSVSAAASIAVAGVQRRFLVRLVTTAGHNSGFGSGPHHLDAVLSHLAVIELRDLGHLATLLGTVSRRGDGNGGAVAVLTGDGRSGDGPGGGPGGPCGRATTVVTFTTGPGAPPGRSGGPVVVDDATSFAGAWDLAMAASKTSAGV